MKRFVFYFGGCLLIFLAVGALLSLVGIPFVASYLNSIDTQPIITFDVGEAYTLPDGSQLILSHIQDDSRCDPQLACNESGFVTAIFLLQDGEGNLITDPISIQLSDQPQDAQRPTVTLPNNIVFQVIYVLPASPPSDTALEHYTVRIQLFLTGDSAT